MHAFLMCVLGWREKGRSLTHRDWFGRGSSTAKLRWAWKCSTTFRQNKRYCMKHCVIHSTWTLKCIRKDSSKSRHAFTLCVACLCARDKYISCTKCCRIDLCFCPQRSHIRVYFCVLVVWHPCNQWVMSPAWSHSLSCVSWFTGRGAPQVSLCVCFISLGKHLTGVIISDPVILLLCSSKRRGALHATMK